MNEKITTHIWLRWSYGVLVGVIFNFVLDVVFSLVYSQYSLFQPISHYLISVSLTYIVFEILFLINKRLKRNCSWRNKPYLRFTLQFLLNSIIAIIIVDSLRWVISLSFDPIVYIRLLDEMILIGLIAFTIFIFTILELSINLLTSWRFSLAELERFKKENAEIRFESLRSQLNPHFLFNSLNTLSSLVYENQENAGLFIRKLSDVYRHILDNRDHDLVSIRKELDFAQSYIYLIQLRFESNLVVNNNTQNANEKLRIAPLTLQLLIENAVKHNIISKKIPLNISIEIVNNILVVRNNLQPKKTKEYSNRMGLANIKSRYDFLTDREVEVSETDNEFIVKIPLL